MEALQGPDQGVNANRFEPSCQTFGMQVASSRHFSGAVRACYKLAARPLIVQLLVVGTPQVIQSHLISLDFLRGNVIWKELEQSLMIHHFIHQ